MEEVPADRTTSLLSLPSETVRKAVKGQYNTKGLSKD